MWLIKSCVSQNINLTRLAKMLFRLVFGGILITLAIITTRISDLIKAIKLIVILNFSTTVLHVITHRFTISETEIYINLYSSVKCLRWLSYICVKINKIRSFEALPAYQESFNFLHTPKVWIQDSGIFNLLFEKIFKLYFKCRFVINYNLHTGL
jgi:hypothetical protein